MVSKGHNFRIFLIDKLILRTGRNCRQICQNTNIKNMSRNCFRFKIIFWTKTIFVFLNPLGSRKIVSIRQHKPKQSSFDKFVKSFKWKTIECLPQVLYACLESFIKVFNIFCDIWIIKLASFEKLQLFQHFALHHRQCMILDYFTLCWFF